jgi:hypothetical protein
MYIFHAYISDISLLRCTARRQAKTVEKVGMLAARVSPVKPPAKITKPEDNAAAAK